MLSYSNVEGWAFKALARQRQNKRCFQKHHEQVTSQLPFTCPWLPLVLYQASMSTSPTSAYQIFTLTFQMYTLFTLDSIKYLHIMKNIYYIFISPCFSCCESRRLFGTFLKSQRRIGVQGVRVSKSGDRSSTHLQL